MLVFFVEPKSNNYHNNNKKHNIQLATHIYKDGLSGSVSAASGEVGLLGGTFGQGTVVKGQDRPPSIAIPGLDFVKSPEGRQMIGY
jgi:hypothetical protein